MAGVPTQAISDYNQQILLQFAGSHEELWRNDSLYDLIVVIGYNDAPALPGAGSAIFLHVTEPRTLLQMGVFRSPRKHCSTSLSGAALP